MHYFQELLKRRGMVEVVPDKKGLTYRYRRCTAEEKVPMQQSAWHRAELVVAPAELAPLTATLEYPHAAQIDWRAWDELYGTGAPLNLEKHPELAALLHALHLYGEPCWWCGAAATEPWEGDWSWAAALPQCSRCGWEITPSRQTLEDDGEEDTSI